MRVKPPRRRIIVEARTGFLRFRDAVLPVAAIKPLRSISRERSVFFVMRIAFFFVTPKYPRGYRVLGCPCDVRAER